jgi:U3 small nucleolar RNA-associated protein 12
MFIPGNKHVRQQSRYCLRINQVIVGTKSGTLEIYDLASATCTEVIQAHEGAIWSMDLRPDKTGLITGSADKSVKFWDFELVHDEHSTVSYMR